MDHPSFKEKTKEKKPEAPDAMHKVLRFMQKDTSEDVSAEKIIEPTSTLYDGGDYFRINAELPGIAEERIRIDLEKSTVAIYASYDDVMYRKMIDLPCEVRLSRKRFSNGTLELILEKRISG
jgi:HSP20 family molecular chaperone IbpA